MKKLNFKYIIIAFALALTFFTLNTKIVNANEYNYDSQIYVNLNANASEYNYDSKINVNLNANATENQPLSVTSKSAYLIDYDSGTILYAYNENERMPIASMTKIALLLLAYENIENGVINLTDTVTVSKNASSMGGSQVFLEENGNYTVETLLKSITVASANDASVAIAEKLYGSEKACVEKMNELCKTLNLKNTLFANCTGLPAPMQYSSAKDIAIIFKNLIKHKNYFKYSTVWMDKVAHKNNETEISNTNKLVKFYDGCDGGKTGFTKEAGFCLTATAKRGNMRVIGSVINAPSSKDRFKSVSTMFDYAFSNYFNRCVADNDIPFENKVNIKGGKSKTIETIVKNDCFVFCKRGEDPEVSLSFNYYPLKVPISKGEKVGELIVFKNGVEVAKSDILANETVKSKSILDAIKEIFSSWA